MIVTYTIDSEKDGNSALLAHHQAEDMLYLLNSLDRDLRNEAKHGEGAESAFAEKWREALHRRMDEHCVELGE